MRRRPVLVVAAVVLASAAAFAVLWQSRTTSGDVQASGSTRTTLGTTSTDADATTTSSTTATTTAAPSTTTSPRSASTGATATTAPASPPTSAPSTTEAAPPYRSSIEPVTTEQLGASWTPGIGCTAPADLRAVVVAHWGDDGGVHEGRVIVATGRAEDVAAIFGDLYAARFPIASIVPVAAYGGDDQASMRANNTSGYNCRTVAGSSTLSQHAYGLAIDVNPLVNPYVRGSTVDPPEGRPWADRSRDDPGMIHSGDAVVQAFAARAWSWGGYWSNGQDYQHFSVSGT